MSDKNAALDKEFVEWQRKRLEALRAQLLGDEERALAQVRALQEERGDEAEEFEDRAQESAGNEVRQALHDVDKRRLAAIDRALRKIDEGTYGISDKSGKRIPKARLEATPEAVLDVEEERREESD